MALSGVFIGHRTMLNTLQISRRDGNRRQQPPGRQQFLPTATYFFQLPGDHFAVDPTANTTLAAGWFDDVLRTVPDRPPDGGKWTLKSLRPGAASACVLRDSAVGFLAGGKQPGRSGLKPRWFVTSGRPLPTLACAFDRTSRVGGATVLKCPSL